MGLTALFSRRPGRWLVRALIAVSAGTVLWFAAASAQDAGGIYRESSARAPLADRLVIAVGEAEVMRYPREPGTVIIGDPSIATASLAASDILVLTGLEAGETNLIILDDGGAQIDRMMLSVVERGERVILRRGTEREVFRCRPLCAPSDGSEFTAASVTAPRVIDDAGLSGSSP